jgi:hypothetical protein
LTRQAQSLYQTADGYPQKGIAMFEQVKVRVMPDGRVTREDAAAFLGRKSKTLADWQRLGIGPRPRKIGGRVFYNIDDLKAFVATGAREAVI